MAINIDKDNSGVAFLNKYATNESHPKYKGVVKVNGVQMEVAVWGKRSKKDDKPFLSLSFQTEEEASKYKKDDEDAEVHPDDLPF